MAIFANKKDRRRHNQAGVEGSAAKETVHFEVPDRHANDGVLTKATMPATVARPEELANDTQQSTSAGNADSSGRTPVARSESEGDSAPQGAAANGAANIVASSATASVAGAASETTVAAASGSESATATPEIEPVDIEPEVLEAPAEPTPVFGIADAIRLMRSLPADPNIDLVVRVVRVTLGAVKVSVDDILRDAERKEVKVRESIAALEQDVVTLEKTLHEKRASIAAHQADLRETATVRERLHMADKYTPHPPPPPRDAVRVPLPKPREWEPLDDLPFKTKES